VKVVIVAQEFSSSGGAEKAAVEHYNLLVREGNDVSLIGDFSALPSAKGLKVEGRRVRNYAELDRQGILKKLGIAARGLFDISLFVRTLLFLIKTKPEIVHFHKVKQLSPLLYLAVKLLRLPTVATIHDHYLTCLNSTRIQGDGSFCQLNRCSFKTALNKKCVGNSRSMTAYSVVEFVLRRQIIKDTSTVRTYIFPSKFLMDWTLKARYQINARIVPNFADISNRVFGKPTSDYVLYFGRLSEEKGVLVLPKIAAALPQVRFRVVGDGPLRETLEEMAVSHAPNLEIVGPRYGEELSSEIASANAVVFPSVCFENAPLSILESFMHGKPVIASDIGGIPELVAHGKNGFLCPPGDASIMAREIVKVLESDSLRVELGRGALASFDAFYNAAAYSRNLADTYRAAIG
jgi:glycosyltransferase involved in cell wall biosynthesis